MREIMAVRDRTQPRLHHLVPIDRDAQGRFHTYPRGLTHQERDVLSYMLSVLAFSYLQLRYVSLRQTTQSFARYELLRQAGWTHPQAVDRLLYG